MKRLETKFEWKINVKWSTFHSYHSGVRGVSTGYRLDGRGWMVSRPESDRVGSRIQRKCSYKGNVMIAGRSARAPTAHVVVRSCQYLEEHFYIIQRWITSAVHAASLNSQRSILPCWNLSALPCFSIVRRNILCNFNCELFSFTNTAVTYSYGSPMLGAICTYDWQSLHPFARMKIMWYCRNGLSSRTYPTIREKCRSVNRYISTTSSCSISLMLSKKAEVNKIYIERGISWLKTFCRRYVIISGLIL
jgi:hypothetical protein